jgi:preprotein translocase subunit SecA
MERPVFRPAGFCRRLVASTRHLEVYMRLFSRRPTPVAPGVIDVNSRRAALARLSDDDLTREARQASTLVDVVASTAVVAERVLGQRMFDEQILAALEMAGGRIIEMQTGEGKTLAAVPTVVWWARERQGVHVLTANDYLAARDAEWMGGIYRWMGVSVASIGQRSSPAERRAAYLADVTYSTANEVGFDYLRDGLALSPAELVHQGFASALLDEADSLLIDEARIPLVIAGAEGVGTLFPEKSPDPFLADRAVRELVPNHHFTVDAKALHVALTPAGVAFVERATGCGNLFDDEHLPLHAAVQDALHAHAILRRDVDYVVADGRVLTVDEFKGRLVPERRWPAGLHIALEVKEGVRRQAEGRVLGSITVEHLVGMYARVAGMTGTAATQAGELREVYGLEVTTIPPHRPVVRVDYPDVVFQTRAEKDAAVRAEIRQAHSTGRPILVGTPSVEESERLSRALPDVPHHVLNARNESAEAAIVARAGERGAVTISTNMAGRGVDIRLGEGVEALGGLYVIATHRHDSRRIDHQLRGRAGRQGDPGSSRFFVSREDPLMAKYAEDDPGITPDQYQRIIEGRHLETRIFLRKYESILEAQRQQIADQRRQILEGEPDAAARAISLRTIDELWADYLAAVSELRSGSAWISLGYGDPLGHYLSQVHAMFGTLVDEIATETAARLESAAGGAPPPQQRGTTWTYLTTDEPFGRMTERIMKNLVARFRSRRS